MAPVLHSSRHGRPCEACVAAAVQAEEHSATCTSHVYPVSTTFRLSMREMVSAIVDTRCNHCFITCDQP